MRSVVLDAGRERAPELLEAALDSIGVGVAVLDECGVVVLTNTAWDRAMLGAGCDVYGGADFLAACEEAMAEVPAAGSVATAVRAILAGQRDSYELEYPDGAPFGGGWLQLRIARHDHDGRGRLVVQLADVTSCRLAQDDARLRAQLLDEVDAAVIATDADNVITHWSRGAARLYGWTAAETIGRRFDESGVMPGGPVADREIREAVARSGHWEARCEIIRKDGAERPALVRLTSLTGAGGEPRGVVGVAVDVSVQAQAERELLLTQSLSRAVTQSMGEGLCAVDEDGRLLYMNAAAEAMLGWTLPEITGRVMHLVIHGHRPDGSPFPPEECPINRSRVEGETIRVEDDAFIRRDGTMLPVAYTASPFETPEGLRGSVFVFSDITERKARQAELRREMQSLTWIPRISDALAEDRMLLHAQPIIDLATGETVQHELLVRMRDTDGTLIPPGLFLPVAEEHGLIGEIDRWVIGQGMRLAASGHAVELNLSARSLGDANLLEHMETTLRESGANPHLVCFELTETALLQDEEAAGRFIARAEALGCHLALDDFGTGYGGFTYLKRFPVDFLKIDVEFVRDLPRDPASQHVVRAVVNLARGFGQKTVAEGVEDQETLQMLAEFGVDLAQGYHIGRPAPLDQTLLQASANRR